jgi:hypothetical protein
LQDVAGLFITAYATYFDEHQLISQPVVCNMSFYTDISLQTPVTLINVLIEFHSTGDTKIITISVISMLGGKIKKVIMKPIGTTKISVNPE